MLRMLRPHQPTLCVSVDPASPCVSRALALLEHIPSFISPNPYHNYVEGGCCCPVHSSQKHLLSAKQCARDDGNKPKV